MKKLLLVFAILTTTSALAVTTYTATASAGGGTLLKCEDGNIGWTVELSGLNPNAAHATRACNQGRPIAGAGNIGSDSAARGMKAPMKMNLLKR